MNIQCIVSYLLACIFFFIDLLVLALWHKQIGSLLLCYYFLLFCRNAGLALLIFTALLCCLESATISGQSYAPLLLIVPLSLLIRHIRSLLHNSDLLPYGAITVYTLLSQLVINPYVVGIQSSYTYTFYFVSANLVFMLGISLIGHRQGRRDNRF